MELPAALVESHEREKFQRHRSIVVYNRASGAAQGADGPDPHGALQAMPTPWPAEAGRIKKLSDAEGMELIALYGSGSEDEAASPRQKVGSEDGEKAPFCLLLLFEAGPATRPHCM